MLNKYSPTAYISLKPEEIYPMNDMTLSTAKPLERREKAYENNGIKYARKYPERFKSEELKTIETFYLAINKDHPDRLENRWGR